MKRIDTKYGALTILVLALLLGTATTASAATYPGVWDSRTTSPRYVRTPLVELSFSPHFFYNPASGSPVPAGIAWWVGNVDAVTAPDTSTLSWTSGDALNYTPPTDYWIDQTTESVALPDRQGRHTIWQAFKAYDADNTTIDTFTTFVNVWFDKTRPATYAPRSACCKRYANVTLRFRVTDNLSPKARVVIAFKRGGTIRKTMSCGWRLTWPGPPSPNARKTFRCTLPKGKYKFIVRATDLAGNKATRLGNNTLIVY